MYEHDLLTWEQFEQKFLAAFDREMTPDKYRWFRSIWEVVNERDRQESKSKQRCSCLDKNNHPIPRRLHAESSSSDTC